MSKKTIDVLIVIFIGILLVSFTGKQLIFFYSKIFLNNFFSKFLGTHVRIGQISAEFFPGWFEIKNLEIFNPPGYQSKRAFYVHKIWVNIGYLETLLTKKLVIQTMIIDRPVAVFEFKKEKGNNWADIFQKNKKNKKQNASGKFFDFMLKKFYLIQGKIILLDDQFATPSSKIVLKNIKLKILRLGGNLPPDKLLTVYSGKAKIGNKARLKFEGVGNFLKPKIDFDLRLFLETLELADFKPYFVKIPIKILEGKVFSEVKVKCRQAGLSGEAKIKIKDFKVKKTGGIIDGLVDYLKEKGGVLDLYVPVSGTIYRPKINFIEAVGEVLAEYTEKSIDGFFRGLFNIK